MAKSGSFKIPDTQIDTLIGHWKEEEGMLHRMLVNRITAATRIVYATARKRRGYITTVSKTGGPSRKVSNPNDPYGVAVSAINGGALRASITMDVHETSNSVKGTVGTSHSYAKFLEYGTSKMQARPFIRPALHENVETIRKIFQQHA